jgi:uridine phosphorylase
MAMARLSEIVTRSGRLYHLGIAPQEIGRSIFLVGDPARAYKVAARFESIDHEVRHREYVTLSGKYRGLPMSAVGTGIGTDNVEIALIELHAAHALDLDSRLPKEAVAPLDIIRIGTSGGVQPEIAPGTLCVAEYALGLDSTGIYYASPPVDEVVVEIEREAHRLLDEAVDSESRFHGRIPAYASKAHPEVHAALRRSAGAATLPSESGITVSAPGFFGPSSRHMSGVVNTVPDIKGLLAGLSVAGRRVLNMEMESSLLFHLAGALGHRAGTICPVIGRPGRPDAVADYDQCIEAAIDVALAAAVELTKKASESRVGPDRVAR